MNTVFVAIERYGNYYPMEVEEIYVFQSRESAETFTKSKPATEGFHWEIIEKGIL